jgi:hypothetical protein
MVCREHKQLMCFYDQIYMCVCEFSIQAFILSLDPILGYYIKPNVSINRQPGIVKLSIAIITLMFLSGLASESLFIMKFSIKETREVDIY